MAREDKSELIEVPMGFVTETDAAWGLRRAGEKNWRAKPVWLPKRFCSYNVKAAVATMPLWLAEREDLI